MQEGRRIGGDDAQLPLHPGQGAFDDQHGADFGAVGEQRGGFVIAEQGAIQGGNGGGGGHGFLRLGLPYVRHPAPIRNRAAHHLAARRRTA